MDQHRSCFTLASRVETCLESMIAAKLPGQWFVVVRGYQHLHVFFWERLLVWLSADKDGVMQNMNACNVGLRSTDYDFVISQPLVTMAMLIWMLRCPFPESIQFKKSEAQELAMYLLLASGTFVYEILKPSVFHIHVVVLFHLFKSSFPLLYRPKIFMLK